MRRTVVSILLILLFIPFTSNPIQVEGKLNLDYDKLELGITTGYLNQGEADIYEITLQPGVYDFYMTGPDNKDWWLYIMYDVDFIYTYVHGLDNPKNISLTMDETETYLVKIRSNDGYGEYTLDVRYNDFPIIVEQITDSLYGVYTSSANYYKLNVMAGFTNITLDCTNSQLKLELYTDSFTFLESTSTSKKSILYNSTYDKPIIIKISGAPIDQNIDYTIFEVEYLPINFDNAEFSGYLRQGTEIILSLQLPADNYVFTINTLDGNQVDFQIFTSYFNLLEQRSNVESSEVPKFFFEDISLYLRIYASSGSGSFNLSYCTFDYPVLQVGDNEAFLDLGEITIFEIELTLGYYTFSLIDPPSSNFDLILKDSFMSTVDYSSDELANDEILYDCDTSNKTMYLEIKSIDGSGTFNLMIHHVGEAIIPEDYIIPEEAILFFEITDIKDKQFDITLRMISDIFNMFLVGTINPILFEDAISYEMDDVLNPHLLAYEDEAYSDTYDDHHLSYNGPTDTVYLVVYSIRMLDDRTLFDSGFKILSEFNYTQVYLSDDIGFDLEYKVTGSLSDNADEVWDDYEYVIYTGYNLKQGDILDAVIEIDNYYIGFTVIFFDGDSWSDINDFTNAINDNYLNNVPIPSNYYNFVVYPQYNIFSLSYKAPVNMTVNIALAPTSFSGYEKVSYSMWTNILYEGTIIYLDHTVSSNSSNTTNSPIAFPMIVLGILVSTTLSHKKRRRKNK